MRKLQTTNCMLCRAAEWFLKSGIQESNGGVARYYRSDLRKNARVSTEITGYAASALVYLGERSGKGDYTEAGIRAARFLTRAAWSPSLATFPFEHSENGDHPEPLTYFFDCGIIVRGLLCAWRATRDDEFLDVATAAGRSMIEDFHARATIHPILRLPDKQPLAYEPRWSASPGCYQLKAAMAWLELFEETGERIFQHEFEIALTGAIEAEAVFLPGDVDRERVMDRLHAYCYFLEGLLPYAARSDCAQALEAGIVKTSKYLYEIAPVFARSDVYAQLLRVRLFAADAGAVPLDEALASSEAAAISQFQLDSGDPQIAGGFAFGRKGAAMLPFVNPVSTAFGAQALALWNDYRDGSLDLHRPTLV